MTQKEINELKARVYSISNCMFPLDAFLNDIEKNKNQNYDKEGAYNDLKLITDAIYELKEKLKEKEKEQDCTLEECKKLWENDGWIWVIDEENILYLKKEYNKSYYIIFDLKYEELEFSFSTISIKLLERVKKTMKALGW